MAHQTGDVDYRGFRLSAVQQGDGWMVTVWPTSVNQALPDDGNVPAQATTRDEALERARRIIDRMPNLEQQAPNEGSHQIEAGARS